MQRILEKPTLWLHPDFKLIRSHISAIGKDRIRFPILDETKVIGAIDNITDSTMQLSPDFVTGVYNRTICSEEDYKEHPIVLQVFSSIGCRHRNYFCSVKKQSIVVNHVSFVVVDSTGNLLSIKLASQMHHLYESGELEEGSIIKLMRFQSIYFNYDCSTGCKPTNLIVLSLDLKVIGKKDKLFSEEILKIKRLEIRKVTSCTSTMNIPTMSIPTAMPPTSTVDMGLLPLTQATECISSDAIDLVTELADTSTCTGNMCSVYGVSFIQCICITHPIDQLSLKDISSECHFLDGKCWKRWRTRVSG